MKDNIFQKNPPLLKRWIQTLDRSSGSFAYCIANAHPTNLYVIETISQSERYKLQYQSFKSQTPIPSAFALRAKDALNSFLI